MRTDPPSDTPELDVEDGALSEAEKEVIKFLVEQAVRAWRKTR